MSSLMIWLLISITVLAVVAVLEFIVAKHGAENNLTPLAILAFVFVLLGIIFGEERLFGYGIMAVGVVFAVFDIFMRQKTAA